MSGAKTAVAVLRAARKLIEQPGCWCQGAYNKDGNGNDFVPDNEAVSWCMEGAIYHVCHSTYGGAAPLDLLTDVIGTHIPDWNDHPKRTHAEVLDAFDRAIARVSGGAP